MLKPSTDSTCLRWSAVEVICIFRQSALFCDEMTFCITHISEVPVEMWNIWRGCDCTYEETVSRFSNMWCTVAVVLSSCALIWLLSALIWVLNWCALVTPGSVKTQKQMIEKLWRNVWTCSPNSEILRCWSWRLIHDVEVLWLGRTGSLNEGQNRQTVGGPLRDVNI